MLIFPKFKGYVKSGWRYFECKGVNYFTVNAFPPHREIFEGSTCCIYKP